MSSTIELKMARKPGGRSKVADQNDDLILQAAKVVFVQNPDAPISMVAKKAGVGIAALYRRYQSKEHLLATLCLQGQRVYIAEAQAALARSGSGWDAYVDFLKRIVAEDTHSLSSRLARTFTPTEVHARLGAELRELGERLFQQAQSSGVMRRDVTFLDVGFMLEAISQVHLGSPARTAELHQRLLALMIDSLRVEASTHLPGNAPTWEEQDSRWIPRSEESD